MARTYLELLKDPQWQRKRLEILQRDEWTCQMCGDKETTLHVHHLRYRRGGMPWDVHPRSLVTLCENCHEGMHGGEDAAMLLEALIAGGIDAHNLARLEGTLDVAFVIDSMKGRKLSHAEWGSVIDQLGKYIDAFQDAPSTPASAT